MLPTGWLLFAGGVIVGVVGGRYLLAQPEGRNAAKAALKRGFAMKEWASTQIETLREDIADLVAEAREEHERERDGTDAVPVAQA